MKIRSPTFWFVVVIMALIAVLWLGKKQPVETPPIALIETNTTPPAVATPTPSVVSMSVHTNAPTLLPGTNAVQTSPLGKWAQIQPILATVNDIPINF